MMARRWGSHQEIYRQKPLQQNRLLIRKVLDPNAAESARILQSKHLDVRLGG